MKLLAIIESKQKRLRAYLPEFVTPFDIFMTRYCVVHDELNENNDSRYVCPQHGNSCKLVDQLKEKTEIYLLVQTDVMDATDFEGVAKNKDGFIVACFSVRTLMSEFGMRVVTPSTTWDEFIGSFTGAQLRQSYKVLPIPSMVVDRKGRSTNGMATMNAYEGTTDWSYPTGITYLTFGQNIKRPTAYTLDSVPGITAHFTNHLMPGMVDRLHMVTMLPDISITKDASCKVDLDNSLAIANGLLYYSKTETNNYYLYGATDVFTNQVFPYAAVMMLDFSDMYVNKSMSKYLFKELDLISVSDQGLDYEIILSMPDFDLTGKTPLISFDGRLLRFDRVFQIGPNTIRFLVSKSEIQHMRERDMQLTETVKFNTRHIKLLDNVEDWIKAQFGIFEQSVLDQVVTRLEADTFRWEDMTDEEHELLIADEVFGPTGGNCFRSFVAVLPVDEVYEHEYLVNSRVNYNGLLISGNVEGVLQSIRGLEIFEHVICKYMSQRVLTPVDFQTWVNGSSSVFTQKANPEVFIDLDASEQGDYDPEVESTAYTDYSCNTKVGTISAITKAEDTDIVTSITVNDVVYTKKETNMDNLLYGSDTHLIGYQPYEFLTTLESQSNYLHDPDTAFLSTPYIDRMAKEATDPDLMVFRLLDFVKL